MSCLRSGWALLILAAACDEGGPSQGPETGPQGTLDATVRTPDAGLDAAPPSADARVSGGPMDADVPGPADAAVEAGQDAATGPSCTELKCAHSCSEGARGAYCTCGSGQAIGADGTSCAAASWRATVTLTTCDNMGPRLSTASNGSVAVTWTEDFATLRAARYQGGTWQAPDTLFTDTADEHIKGQGVFVDASGETTVLYHTADESMNPGASYHVRSRRHVAGAWLAPTDLETRPVDDVEVQLVGDDRALYAVWERAPWLEGRRRRQQWFSRLVNGQWSTPSALRSTADNIDTSALSIGLDENAQLAVAFLERVLGALEPPFDLLVMRQGVSGSLPPVRVLGPVDAEPNQAYPDLTFQLRMAADGRTANLSWRSPTAAGRVRVAPDGTLTTDRVPWPAGVAMGVNTLVLGELELALWPAGPDAVTGRTLLTSQRRGLGDWSAPQTLTTNYGAWQNTRLVPLSGGDVMAVWVDETSADGTVQAARFLAAEARWEAPQRLSDRGTSSAFVQAGADAQGRVTVIWLQGTSTGAIVNARRFE